MLVKGAPGIVFLRMTNTNVINHILVLANIYMKLIIYVFYMWIMVVALWLKFQISDPFISSFVSCTYFRLYIIRDIDFCEQGNLVGHRTYDFYSYSDHTVISARSCSHMYCTISSFVLECRKIPRIQYHRASIGWKLLWKILWPPSYLSVNIRLFEYEMYIFLFMQNTFNYHPGTDLIFQLHYLISIMKQLFI